MTLYQAIDQMRAISAQGGTFSIAFRKWDRHRNKGGDLARIENARLRPAAHEEDLAHAELKLFITDTDTGRAVVCWRPLVMHFNDTPLTCR